MKTKKFITPTQRNGDFGYTAKPLIQRLRQTQLRLVLIPHAICRRVLRSWLSVYGIPLVFRRRRRRNGVMMARIQNFISILDLD